MHNASRSQNGTGLIEIVIAVAIIATSFAAIAQIGMMALAASSDRNDKVRALSLAQEGIEAVRNMRDGSFSGNITPLASGTTYYAVVSGGKWALSTTNPGVLLSKFTRTIVLSDVSRDGSDNIVSSGGTNDPKTKKVTVTVSWGTPVKTFQLISYIADILKN